MDPLTCPLGTPWCTDHEPPDTNWAECVRIIGKVTLDHGPATAGFRSEPDDGTPGEVIISIRQIEGDAPMVEVEWPDSTAEFPGGWRPGRPGRPGRSAGTWCGPLDCWRGCCDPFGPRFCAYQVVSRGAPRGLLRPPMPGRRELTLVVTRWRSPVASGSCAPRAGTAGTARPRCRPSPPTSPGGRRRHTTSAARARTDGGRASPTRRMT